MSVSLRRDLVVLACAISAGIHAALAPAHAGAGAGVGFVIAALLLAALAAALTRHPHRVLHGVAALTLGGLIVGYAAATTTGVPLLHPQPEPLDGLALATKAAEAVGVAAAVGLLGGRRAAPAPRPQAQATSRPAPPIPLFLTALVACFSALAALAVSAGHDAPGHADAVEVRTAGPASRTRR